MTASREEKQKAAKELEDRKTEEIEKINESHYLIHQNGKIKIFRYVRELDLREMYTYPWIEYSQRDWFAKMANQKMLYKDMASGNYRELSLAKIWFESPFRREYEAAMYKPGQTRELKGGKILNLWDGWNLKPDYMQDADLDFLLNTKEELKCQKILDFFAVTICKENPKAFEYLMMLVAEAYHNAHSYKKPGVAPILRGLQGTGKTVASKFISGPFGRHLMEIGGSPGAVFGRFSSALELVSYVVGNEITRTSMRGKGDRLKALITDDFIDIEAKFGSISIVPNHIRWLFTSNSDLIVPIEMSDRRFFTLTVADNHRNDDQYFGDLFECYDHGGRESLWNHLETYDYKNFDFHDIPYDQTSHMVQVADTEKASILGWTWSFIEEECIRYKATEPNDSGKITLAEDAPTEVGSMQLLDCYNYYLEMICQQKSKVNSMQFFHALKAFKEQTKIEFENKKVAGYKTRTIPPLSELREYAIISNMVGNVKDNHAAAQRTGPSESQFADGIKRVEDAQGNITFNFEDKESVN